MTTRDSLRAFALRAVVADIAARIAAAETAIAARNRPGQHDHRATTAAAYEIGEHLRETLGAVVHFSTSPARMSLEGVSVTCAAGGMQLLRDWLHRATTTAARLDGTAREDVA